MIAKWQRVNRRKKFEVLNNYRNLYTARGGRNMGAA